MSHAMSHDAVYETAEPALTDSAFAESSPEPMQPPLWRPRGRGGVLLASLAGAFVTTCLSGASLYYAFTHIAEVDPNAEAAPVAAIAAMAAEAPDTPAKLDVLTPPVYGPELINEAPAAPFVPLSARVSVSTVDINALTQADGPEADETQADGATRPCADPCSAQAGYAAPTDAGQPAPMPASDVTHPANTETDDDGNAPPPPDMTVN